MTLSVEEVWEVEDFPLREEDARFLKEQNCTLQGALDVCCKAGGHSYAIKCANQTIALWGYVPSGDECYLWLISGTEVSNHLKSFGRLSRYVVADVLALYPKVFVTVDPHYDTSVRWLRWLGFRRVEFIEQNSKMQLDRGS